MSGKNSRMDCPTFSNTCQLKAHHARRPAFVNPRDENFRMVDPQPGRKKSRPSVHTRQAWECEQPQVSNVRITLDEETPRRTANYGAA
jgi:hypothetical protein